MTELHSGIMGSLYSPFVFCLRCGADHTALESPLVIPVDSVSVSLSHLQEVFSRYVGGQTSSVDASVMLSSRLGGGWFTNLIQ